MIFITHIFITVLSYCKNLSVFIVFVILKKSLAFSSSLLRQKLIYSHQEIFSFFAIINARTLISDRNLHPRSGSFPKVYQHCDLLDHIQQFEYNRPNKVFLSVVIQVLWIAAVHQTVHRKSRRNGHRNCKCSGNILSRVMHSRKVKGRGHRADRNFELAALVFDKPASQSSPTGRAVIATVTGHLHWKSSCVKST